ncbi:MAG: hypothetical protein ABJB66_07760 [Gemmatimonadaceae bacterium]
MTTAHHSACPSTSLRAVLAFTALLTACGGSKLSDSNTSSSKPATASSRISTCKLMPKEEISKIVGEEFTSTESNDDGHSSESNCVYANATNPVGLTVNITWINPRDYSNPAEHAALQKAMIGGAKLGGALETQTMGGAGLPGVKSGPVEGLGDEATQTLLLLTVRKGDYSVMVQMYPRDMMKLMTDSSYANAILDKEKTIARQTIAKL